MREIIFLRHAKSDWATEFLRDIDRPLNERGYADAYRLSAWYRKNGTRPDKLLCSTATRAFSTAMIFAREMEFPHKKIVLEPGIYESPVQRLISIISAQEDHLKTLLMVGHNPGFTQACNYLSGKEEFDNVPTCGIVSFRLTASSWGEVTEGSGELNYFQYPKNLKNQDD